MRASLRRLDQLALRGQKIARWNSSSSGESARMPTARSLGFEMKLRQSEDTHKKEGGRKLAIICGWMGAKDRQLRVYQEFYHKKNFDTLSFACGPQHIMLPSHASKTMASVCDEVISLNYDTLVFHHFSMGGYLFGQMLRHLQENEDKRRKLVDKIKVQVFDSPPDFSGIAKGVAQSMGKSGVVASAVELLMRAYLFVSSSTAGVQHRAASKAFHTNAITAPSLWFYSRSDPVANYEDCEIVIESWKSKGTMVKSVVWDDTPHIQHARVDPALYFGTLESFIDAAKVEEKEEAGDVQQWNEGEKARAI